MEIAYMSRGCEWNAPREEARRRAWGLAERLVVRLSQDLDSIWLDLMDNDAPYEDICTALTEWGWSKGDDSERFSHPEKDGYIYVVKNGTSLIIDKWERARELPDGDGVVAERTLRVIVGLDPCYVARSRTGRWEALHVLLCDETGWFKRWAVARYAQQHDVWNFEYLVHVMEDADWEETNALVDSMKALGDDERLGLGDSAVCGIGTTLAGKTDWCSASAALVGASALHLEIVPRDTIC